MVAIPVPSQAAGRASMGAHVGVRLWLGFLIALVFTMMLVGGATRLTESGLSITEWKPVVGAIPPLGDAAWQDALDRYRQSPQYELLNRGMSLAEFRTIFWWEWWHRELGRLIGLVYIAGFLWITVRRAVPPRTIAVLAGMGLLLGTQGLAGWIMVASGLQPGMSAVAPVSLALHLTLACLFFSALVAMFVRLGGAVREQASPGMHGWAGALIVLAFVQIALGGLVAGHDAGLTYNTWPLMEGRLVPAGLLTLEPAWLNLVDNIATIQFDHRIGAYAMAAASLAYLLAARKETSPLRARAFLMAGLVLVQIALGVATLVYVVPIPLALAHQGMALILLLVLVWNASVFGRETLD